MVIRYFMRLVAMSRPEPPYTHGNLSVVVPMDDMVQILTQLWKSRSTEPKIGELYEKYKALIPAKE